MVLYHVSRGHLGARVILTPKHPETAGPKEAALPLRVCFAPSIEQCLASMSGARVRSLVIGEIIPRRRRLNDIWHHANPSVYVTSKRLRKPPQDLCDFSITRERWSLRPIEVEHVGFVCLAHLARHSQVRLIKRASTPQSKMSTCYQESGALWL